MLIHIQFKLSQNSSEIKMIQSKDNHKQQLQQNPGLTKLLNTNAMNKQESKQPR